MSLKDIELKINYTSDIDNILKDFYIPALSQSKHYYRLAGFFTSSALAVAAKGIANLIKNNGDMKLICSARFNEEDINEIKNNQSGYNEIVENVLLRDINFFEDFLMENHVKALGWLYANKRLHIKVAILQDDDEIPFDYIKVNKLGMFHLKVGIMEDSEGNQISFSGSINETKAGWLNNIEEFKVFKSWDELGKSYLEKDFEKFNDFWNSNHSTKIFHSRVKVLDIPTAIEQKLIDLAPKDISDLDLKERKKPVIINPPHRQEIILRKYQKEALAAWLKNNKKGIFEMATGTGKTITALGCLNKIYDNNENCISIISCPQTHLVQQWEEEIKKFNIKYDSLLIASGSNYKWRKILSDAIDNNILGYENKIIIITTHDTFSSEDFQKLLKKVESPNLFLIADEVHGIGSIGRRKGLAEIFNFRLGLSATPKRWFDEKGTQKLYDYFGDVVFEFPLSKALIEINPETGQTFLTPYRYLPKFTILNDDELEKYIELTKKIIVLYSESRKNTEAAEKLERLLFLRADIIKDAKNKIELLKEILKELGSDIKWTIIYCSPKQIDEVVMIVNKLNIRAHRFTMTEGVTPSNKYGGLTERDYLLKNFAIGKYQVLVAMKCLDEGVDIPPARQAIIMSSSTNPREYIQRIGRVVRRFDNKKEAIIYDLIVVPSFNGFSKEIQDVELKIFEKEMIRFLEIANNAVNSITAVKAINEKYYNNSIGLHEIKNSGESF